MCCRPLRTYLFFLLAIVIPAPGCLFVATSDNGSTNATLIVDLTCFFTQSADNWRDHRLMDDFLDGVDEANLYLKLQGSAVRLAPRVALLNSHPYCRQVEFAPIAGLIIAPKDPTCDQCRHPMCFGRQSVILDRLPELTRSKNHSQARIILRDAPLRAAQALEDMQEQPSPRQMRRRLHTAETADSQL
jgi:hypothetical protein